MGAICTQATTLMNKMEVFLPSGSFNSWNDGDVESWE